MIRVRAAVEKNTRSATGLSSRVDKSQVRPLTGISLKSCIDTLRPIIPGATVCDLYAGEGRFAQACLHEGALRVVMVERDRRQCARLQKTVHPAVLIQGESFDFLRHTQEWFDIIFCDPPFPDWTQKFADELCQLVSKRLNNGGIFLVKNPARMVVSLGRDLELIKESKFGESRLTYLKNVAFP